MCLNLRLTGFDCSGTLPRLNGIFYCPDQRPALDTARHITHGMSPDPIERIGIDESGKGDYFGPLVVAAVFVDATTQDELALMAVRDSKKISDGRILELAPDIRTICPHSVIVIGPQKYNELYAKIKNLNRLLAWGHAKALETLLERVPCGRAISDQFGDERLILNALQEKGRKIVLEQRTKAESDLAVAAASIVARAEFLLRLKRLSEDVGTTLPKGASPAVELAARMVVKKYGEPRLAAVAKLHFRTTKAVLGASAGG
jgi:ribonuclease HIII